MLHHLLFKYYYQLKKITSDNLIVYYNRINIIYQILCLSQAAVINNARNTSIIGVLKLVTPSDVIFFYLRA